MENVAFLELFEPNSQALRMGLVLRELVFSSFSGIDESIIGGAKVKLALYNRGGKNNVLCGIQQGAGDSCMLYVHHVDTISHKRLKFSGSGKHAKRIKFSDENEIFEEDIIWLFKLLKDKAPF